ncbi:fatty acid elongase-like protein [Lasiosphaeris hirsuta]|uniref:Elongation of fatty acids protein n=1 Tax=Lasiosphaeris hirsuta TaxID=260670 RepID=A0AA40A8U5_9PEZI|nr:fatty acid elongase-like protein [Lasiosphaeris hirsuta]
MAFNAPVFLALPQSSLFTFPPNSNPTFIAPPPTGSNAFAPPFDIPNHVYQAVLDPKVPLTIAAVYTVTAKLLNAYNRSTGKKPWAVSKTTTFRWLVVLHNILLAVYSAWTWWGMFGALRRSMVSPLGPSGLSGFVDSVCYLNGPGGLGNAVFYSEDANAWISHSSEVVLTSDGAPSPHDMGRIWNEGLAFYGWLFYLSKFYEVIDTLIILAKGRLGSTLQTYHHAGAMMCMWAGMRYNSAPIWMFVFFNSGIHAMMYTYYTVTSFNVRVPMFIKRTLTSLQITQFIVGASYAMLHSFVNYTIPVASATQDENPTASAAAVNNSASAGVIDMIKGSYTQQSMPCITTTGATFAVWLNVFYLAPLTYLFGSFFVQSYLRRSNAGAKSAAKAGKEAASRRLSNNVALAEKAGWEAARNVEREVYGKDNEEAIEDEKNTNGR